MRAIRAAVAAAACVAAVACFEEPVREHLHLTLIADQAFVVTTVQEVAPPEVAGSNPQLAARLDETRAAIERGFDRWRPLYEELQPVVERYTLEKVDGAARRALYSAAVTDFDSVARLLGSQGLGAILAHHRIDGDLVEHELRIDAIGSPSATTSERQEIERRLDEWAVKVAAYLADAAAFYEYLDRRPDRAVPCLSQLFEHPGAESETLDRAEEELVSRLVDRIQAVAGALRVEPGAAYTLNERSRLAFDPFPARLTVAVRGTNLEIEGLVEGDGFLERPAVDLWRALASLEGRWLSPDLVTAMIAPVPHEQQPEPDPESFATLTRRFRPAPSPSEVAAALRAELVPPELHRVRWRSGAADAAGLADTDPRSLLDAAQADVPP